MARLRDAGSPAIPDRGLDDVVRRGATSPIARLAAAAGGLAPLLLSAGQLGARRSHPPPPPRGRGGRHGALPPLRGPAARLPGPRPARLGRLRPADDAGLRKAHGGCPARCRAHPRRALRAPAPAGGPGTLRDRPPPGARRRSRARAITHHRSTSERTSDMSNVSIIGAYNTQFGAFVKKDKATGLMTDTKTYYELLVEAGRGAIADAGLEAKDIDAVFVGSCSPGSFVNQEHVAPIAAEIHPDLRFKPMTRCECACASGSVALYAALYAVEAGRAKRVLVIGVEKMNLLPTPQMTHVLACSSHWPTEGSKGMSFPMLFAEYAKGYQAHYKIKDADLEKMLWTAGALCYRNGAENPLAHVRNGPTTVEAIMKLNELDAKGKCKNMMIAPPLRLPR